MSFLGIWTYKIKTPVNRPDEYTDGYDENAGAWWDTSQITVDDDWKLDPEIPLNYMPVPGEDELYMVVDNNGTITGYRKRTKQIDGSWLWSDVNPDIPDDYEAVDGLDNIYKVTALDGSVTYYKYIRNNDDTYAFVKVDENGNAINKNRDATTIDGKHVHITGNIYSELNDNGVVIGYDRRIDNGDGTFSWMETTLPELRDMSKYANNLGEFGSSLSSDAMSINGNGPISLDTSDVDKMAQQMAEANDKIANSAGDTYNISITQNPDSSDDSGYMEPSTDFSIDSFEGFDDLNDSSFDIDTSIDSSSGSSLEEIIDLNPSTPTVINNSDGTHTEIEIVRETKKVDGWTSTYETYVKKTYDDAGNLISTISEGPYEVDSTQNIVKETEPVQADISKKEENLTDESSRVTGSYTYKTDLANDVFALLNAQRVSNGLSTLKLSEDAMRIAMLRSADMAAYDTSSEDLPTYGTLGTMLTEYSVDCTDPGENLWKSIIRSADDIHTRFQALESARNIRMGTTVTSYGIGIVESNGYYYICEVLL